jgi:hypothetical protein
MKKATKNNNKPASHIEAFLFCPKIAHPKKTEANEHFVSQLNEIEKKLTDCVVFFNLPSALQYSRFMNHEHVVLRAFVEHTAVEGLGHGLGIKKGAVTKHHIHGCFPGWAKGKLYIENPAFDTNKVPAPCATPVC